MFSAGRLARRSFSPFLLHTLLLCALAGPLLAPATFAQRRSADDSKRDLKLGRKLLANGRNDDAEKLYRRMLAARPDLSAAKVELAFTLLRQRHIRAAYDLAFEVARAEPNNARAYAVLGTVLLTAGRFDDARPVLLTAVSLDRGEDLAWAGLGRLNFYENRIEEGLGNLREAVFLQPTEPDYLYALGQVAARAEYYREAADAYRRFLSVARDIEDDRRQRIKGLVGFLSYLGQRDELYVTGGPPSATVPIDLVGNRPIISLKLNNDPRVFRFVLDTGSGMTVVSDRTAAALNIRPITKGGYAKGIGGDGRFEIVYGFVRSVAIGDVRVRNVPVYIRRFHSDTEAIDGYIGLSLISKFLTTIDYGLLTFALAKKDSAAPVNSGHTLPLRLTSSGFLSGEVQLEGLESPLNFIVDTGASVSVISEEIAQSEPFSTFARGTPMRVIGAAGVTDDVPSLELPRVRFGPHSRDRLTAIALNLGLINESSGFEQAGILGGNFLRNYRLTFDFKNSKVTFAPIGAPK
ncbi:MAG: aspartyl protease family protein [Pyrinomonadaceae bacterium]